MQKPALFGIPDAGVGDARSRWRASAVWWLVFSIPLFRRVPEPPRRLEAGEAASAGALVDRRPAARWRRFAELRRYRQAFLLLLAFLLYNDGIQTIIRMATTYGAEMSIDDNAMILALLITQFIGVPFAFLFGMLAGADRRQARRSSPVSRVYAGITILGYYMRTAAQFMALAVLVGMVQGGTQALSRSLFASMIPRHKSSEFFAFFGVFERYAGILGPAVFAWVVEHSGTSRNAILSVVVFFVIGAGILFFVDVDEGRRAARAAEAAVS